MIRLFFALAVCSACAHHTLSTIRTNPPGAKVWLNGKPAGETPVQVDLANGFGWWTKYQVKLEMPGYETTTRHLAQETYWPAVFVWGGLSLVSLAPGLLGVYLNGQKHLETYEFDLTPVSPLPVLSVLETPLLPLEPPAPPEPPQRRDVSEAAVACKEHGGWKSVFGSIEGNGQGMTVVCFDGVAVEVPR